MRNAHVVHICMCTLSHTTCRRCIPGGTHCTWMGAWHASRPRVQPCRTWFALPSVSPRLNFSPAGHNGSQDNAAQGENERATCSGGARRQCVGAKPSATSRAWSFSSAERLNFAPPVSLPDGCTGCIEQRPKRRASNVGKSECRRNAKCALVVVTCFSTRVLSESGTADRDAREASRYAPLCGCWFCAHRASAERRN